MRMSPAEKIMKRVMKANSTDFRSHSGRQNAEVAWLSIFAHPVNTRLQNRTNTKRTGKKGKKKKKRLLGIFRSDMSVKTSLSINIAAIYRVYFYASFFLTGT
jgi:hypothetical protein